MLHEITPGGAVPTRYEAFLLHHLATRAFTAGDAALHGDAYLEAVEEQVPALQSQTAVLLMASLLSDAVASARTGSGPPPAHRIATAVLERAAQAVDPALLARTWRWRRENADQFERSQQDIDLLAMLERFFEPPELARERSNQRRTASQRRFASAEISGLEPGDLLDGRVAGEPLAEMRVRLLDLVKDWQRQRGQAVAFLP